MTMLHLNMTLFWYPNYPQGPTMSTRRRRQQAQASVGARPDLPGKCEIFFPFKGRGQLSFSYGVFFSTRSFLLCFSISGCIFRCVGAFLLLSSVLGTFSPWGSFWGVPPPPLIKFLLALMGSIYIIVYIQILIKTHYIIILISIFYISIYYVIIFHVIIYSGACLGGGGGKGPVPPPPRN